MASDSIPAPVREAMATMTSEEVVRLLRLGQHGLACVPCHTVAAALLLAAQAVERERFRELARTHPPADSWYLEDHTKAMGPKGGKA